MAGHWDQEASRYAQPIIAREDLLALLAKRKKGMSFIDIAKKVNHTQKWQKDALHKRLEAMVRDGQCVFKRDSYRLGVLLPPKEAVFLGLQEGVGRLKASDGALYCLPVYQASLLMPNDLIKIRPLKRKKRGYRQAVLMAILQRSHKTIIGQLLRIDGHWYVKATMDDALHVAVEDHKLYQTGQYVEVEIKQYPTATEGAKGEVVQIMDHENALDLRVHLALNLHDIPHDVPADVAPEVAALPEMQDNLTYPDRTDLRHLPFVTIDGESAGDFDDAVYAESLSEGGYGVWVAIADVAHYVPEGSALDKMAQQRGNSIYFPEITVPMLPQALSNDLCSLRPHCDRLVVVAHMTLDADGAVVDRAFYRAVIHSHARLTYHEVQQMIDYAMPIVEGWEAAFKTLLTVHRLLEKKRQARGCLHFQIEDQQVHFNKCGDVTKISPIKSLESHVLIENLMLLANEAVAYHLHSHKAKDALYRVHPGPGMEKWEQAQPFLQHLGLKAPKHYEMLTSYHYQLWLQESIDQVHQDLVHRTLLRTMQPAVYQTKVGEHFGLAYETYTHFTSPIRRYPDLLTHRALLRNLGLMPGKNTLDMDAIAAHCSMTERRAEAAERDVKKALICLFMKDKVGDVFKSTVRSVTSFGLFVQLDELGIEGLVHITRLPKDYYDFDERCLVLQGRRDGRCFALGDRLVVRLDHVDSDKGFIDFYFLDTV